jgi:hypothetical protein
VVLALVVVLRRPIASLIPSLSRVRYKDFELDFTKKLQELESEAQRSRLPAPMLPEPGQRSGVPTTFQEYIERLSELSPRSAVAEAWRFVETALRDAVERLGRPAPRSPRAMEEVLANEMDIDRRTLSLLAELRNLRNQAVHGEEFALQPEQAREFGELALRIAGALHSLRHRTS